MLGKQLACHPILVIRNAIMKSLSGEEETNQHVPKEIII